MSHVKSWIKSIAINTLILIFIGQASANQSNNESLLVSGTSTSQTVAGTHRHALTLEQASNITVQSQELFPTGAAHFKLSAVLLDAQNNLVARSQPISGGHMELNYSAQPGAYTLVVNGHMRSAKREGTDLYILKTKL